MPVSGSGVILGENIAPHGVSSLRPPANRLSFAEVWHGMPSAALGRQAARAPVLASAAGARPYATKPAPVRPTIAPPSTPAPRLNVAFPFPADPAKSWRRNRNVLARQCDSFRDEIGKFDAPTDSLAHESHAAKSPLYPKLPLAIAVESCGQSEKSGLTAGPAGGRDPGLCAAHRISLSSCISDCAPVGQIARPDDLRGDVLWRIGR